MGDIEGIYVPQKGITQPATDVHKNNPSAFSLKDLSAKSAKEDKGLQKNMIEIALQKHIHKTKLNKVFTDFLNSFWDQFDIDKSGFLDK